MKIPNKLTILNAVVDLVSDFLYYDRKEDEDLPIEGIESSIEHGNITEEEIIEQFAKSLKRGLGR